MFNGKLFKDEDFNHKIKTKKCSSCNRNLPTTNFSNASGGNYLRYECRECGRKKTNDRKKLRIHHPLSDPDKHCCPICNSSAEQAFGKGGQHLKSSWVLDHDHKTGKFRGYICHNCNRGLGIFSDSIDRLKKAIGYLEND